jgi:hypothetical protein
VILADAASHHGITLTSSLSSRNPRIILRAWSVATVVVSLRLGTLVGFHFLSILDLLLTVIRLHFSRSRYRSGHLRDEYEQVNVSPILPMSAARQC